MGNLDLENFVDFVLVSNNKEIVNIIQKFDLEKEIDFVIGLINNLDKERYLNAFFKLYENVLIPDSFLSEILISDKINNFELLFNKFDNDNINKKNMMNFIIENLSSFNDEFIEECLNNNVQDKEFNIFDLRINNDNLFEHFFNKNRFYLLDKMIALAIKNKRTEILFDYVNYIDFSNKSLKEFKIIGDILIKNNVDKEFKQRLINGGYQEECVKMFNFNSNDKELNDYLLNSFVRNPNLKVPLNFLKLIDSSFFKDEESKLSFILKSKNNKFFKKIKDIDFSKIKINKSILLSSVKIIDYDNIIKIINNADIKDIQSVEVLNEAVCNEDINVLKYLCENFIYPKNNLALPNAIEINDFEKVKYLVDYSIFNNSYDNLTVVCKCKDKNIVEFVLNEFNLDFKEQEMLKNIVKNELVFNYVINNQQISFYDLNEYARYITLNDLEKILEKIKFKLDDFDILDSLLENPDINVFKKFFNNFDYLKEEKYLNYLEDVLYNNDYFYRFKEIRSEIEKEKINLQLGDQEIKNINKKRRI